MRRFAFVNEIAAQRSSIAIKFTVEMFTFILYNIDSNLRLFTLSMM
jgi:hypothetical protein